MKNIAAIIPAFNPQSSLITYVHQLLTTTISQIIIVNDGSDDKYANIFEELKSINGCRVLEHDKNIGKGGALKTAFSYIWSQKKSVSRCNNCRCSQSTYSARCKIGINDDKGILRRDCARGT